MTASPLARQTRRLRRLGRRGFARPPGDRPVDAASSDDRRCQTPSKRPARVADGGAALGPLAVRGGGRASSALVVAVDPVRVDAARVGERERQELEADDVDDRMDGRDERRLAAELAQRARPRRAARSAARPSPSRTKARTVSSIAARWPCRSCSVWCASAATHAPSRSFSTASCAVGQSRPAPATSDLRCSAPARASRERLARRRRQPRDVLAAQRRDRGDRARVARGVAPRLLDLGRARRRPPRRAPRAGSRPCR